MRWSTKQWTIWPLLDGAIIGTTLGTWITEDDSGKSITCCNPPTNAYRDDFLQPLAISRLARLRFANLPGNIIPRPITEGARDSSPVAIGLIISHPDGFIRPLAHQLTPTACSLHPPNHVDEIPNPIPLHYSVSSSLRSPLALLTSLVYNAPPHVSESLYGFCLRITSPISSVYFIIVVRIVSSLSSSSFIPLLRDSVDVSCGHPFVQSYKILYAFVF